MNQLDLLPKHLRDHSISWKEIVLPMEQALEAIDLFEARGILILGWEGWIKDRHGNVGHGSAPQGTASFDDLSVHEAAEFCRVTIRLDAEQWVQSHQGTTDTLHFCITVDA